jgi:hypothetical protein
MVALPLLLASSCVFAGGPSGSLQVTPQMLSSRGGLVTVALEGEQSSAPPLLKAPDGSLYQMLWSEGVWRARVWTPESQPSAGGPELRALKFEGGGIVSYASQAPRGHVFRGRGLTLRTYRDKPIASRPNQGLTRTRQTPGLTWPLASELESARDWKSFWAVWSGQLVAEHSGPHQFDLEGAGFKALKVTINRGPVNALGGNFSLNLKAGESVSLRIEVLLDERSELNLVWTPPLGPTETVPNGRLQPEVKGTLKPEAWQMPEDYSARAAWTESAIDLPAPKGGSGYAWARIQQPDGAFLLVEAEGGLARPLIPQNSARAGRLLPSSWLLAGEDGVRLLPGPDIIQDPAPPAFAKPMPDAGLDPEHLTWEKALTQAEETAMPLASASLGRTVYEPLAREAAQKAGIDERVFVRMIEVESAWDPNAMSPVGAMGLGQLMPDTAFELGVEDPFDPVQNLAGAAKYLARQHKRFGSYLLALAAYNAGPGAVSRHGGVPPYRETRRYVRKILGSGR